MEGFNRSIRTKLLGVDPHFTIFAPEFKDSAWMDVILQDWKNRSGIEMNPFAQQDVILRTIDGAFSGGVAKGLSLDALHSFLDRVHRLKFKKGQAPALSGEELQLSPNEVLMGADLARSLNLFEGDEFMVIAP
jgi:ABC-type lipoprotein release transport system permease subunit